jgi:hypothetical protein
MKEAIPGGKGCPNKQADKAAIQVQVQRGWVIKLHQDMETLRSEHKAACRGRQTEGLSTGLDILAQGTMEGRCNVQTPGYSSR